MPPGRPRKNRTNPAQSSAATGGRASIAEFHEMLVLAKWARGFFQTERFGVLRQSLNRRELEGIDEESGQTRFFTALAGGQLFNLLRVDKADFSRYDLNIIRHWAAITEKRNADGLRVELKYFQYLSLLAAELYLDWYFKRPEALLQEINRLAAEHNAARPHNRIAPKDERTPDVFVTRDDLRKAAFWEATGAGKTLLMHVNIRQYLEYAKEARKQPDRVIVLTPNEGLSRQHLDELRLSGFRAEMMRENALFIYGTDGATIVVDSGKLISDASSRKKGEKSFLAENFEGDNLVLVDEGHHGSSKEDGEHRRTRDLLCRNGFSFEYSATFGQAVAGRNATELKKLYATSILFDYSYRYFHEDGYGKEAFILNMPQDDEAEQVFRYLCANLLAYYQQHRLFADSPEVMRLFGIEKPLCIFVGNTVNTENADVERIIGFFAEALERRTEVEHIFAALIRGEDVFHVEKSSFLKERFAPLRGVPAAQIYDDMLRLVFNTGHAARLKVRLEKGCDEITLSVDTDHPFGLVNIGSPGNLVERLAESGRVDARPNEMGESRFARLNDRDSEISVLIGSRKFTEGWSSWRVSAMGLLNMGVNEGTQIIQLFGRGVRLKGRDFSLKRSTGAERGQLAKGAFLEHLETLHIFGIRANYMSKFKEYLEAEGVRTLDEVLTLDFPIRKNPFPDTLLVPQVKDGFRLNQKQGFKTQAVELFRPPADALDKIKKIVVKHDDYALLQMMRTAPDAGPAEKSEPAEAKLDERAFPFFDWDAIYRELLEEKARLGYWNMSIDKAALIDFTHGGNDWYRLLARPEDVTFSSFAKLARIERLFKTLVCAYMRQFYERLQRLYEDEHREMRPIDESWIPESYQFEFEDSDPGRRWENRLEELRGIVADEEVPGAAINQWAKTMPEGLVVIAFRQHLYMPVFYSKKGERLPFTVKPVSLDAPGEANFLKDLEAFYDDPENRDIFADIDLYLMRNASNRLKGVGFAQAGNFYPDFLMWLIDRTENRQYLTFIDPKGLRQLSFDAPKLNFATEVKALQEQINRDRADADRIVLNSVILSDTKRDELTDLRGHRPEEYEAKNVFFMEDKSGETSYLRKLFDAARRV